MQDRRPGLRPGRSAFWAVPLPLLAALLVGCGSGGAPLPAAGPPLAPGEAARLLEQHAPTLHYAARESSFATRVDAFTERAVLRDDAGRAVRRASASAELTGSSGTYLDGPSSGVRERGDVTYGHVVRDAVGRVWLQFWLFSADNLQDRGIVRTGRHEGDWEMVQVGLAGAARRPVTLTLAQHTWAEGCGWGSRGERPGVWVAHGSHASYAAAGRYGRPWPDPTDEALGDGRRVVPEVSVISDRSPAWVGWSGRWGGSRAAGWNPVESASPRGPAFQEAAQWRDPAGFARGARACGSGAPSRPVGLTVAMVGLALLLLGLAVRRRSTSRAA